MRPVTIVLATKRLGIGLYYLRSPAFPVSQLRRTDASFSVGKIRMASQYKNAVTWSHNVAESSDKASRIIDLTMSVAKSEHDHSECGFYVVLSPQEGQHFSQPTRLEIILNHSEDYLEKHRSSNAYMELQNAVERENLFEKPASTMSFTPKAGFLYRSEPSPAPISQQYVFIAKLDSHPGKFDEFLDAIKTHASNVERTENQTLSFVVFQSHDTENSVTLFERYSSEDYFQNVHSTSESMQEYRKKMESLMAERVTAGFQIVAGFVDKREKLT